MEIRDRRCLAKMRDEAGIIVGFISGVDYASFIGNEILKRAVALTLSNIGELARSLSDEAKAQYSYIPWKAIRGARNIIAHDYDVVDFSVIWQTVTESIPELINAINRIENDLGEELFGLSEQEQNRKNILQAIENADAQNGGEQ